LGLINPSSPNAFLQAFSLYDQYLKRIKDAFNSRNQRLLESYIKVVREEIKRDDAIKWSPEIKMILEQLDLHVHEITLRYNTRNEIPEDLVVDMRGEGNPSTNLSQGLNTNDVGTLENEFCQNFTCLPVDSDEETNVESVIESDDDLEDQELGDVRSSRDNSGITTVRRGEGSEGGGGAREGCLRQPGSGGAGGVVGSASTPHSFYKDDPIPQQYQHTPGSKNFGAVPVLPEFRIKLIR